MASDRAEPILSLYVHVPFCAQKCSYCAFYSEASNGDLINSYIDALTTEMERVHAEVRPNTIFFGGGTPSILNLRQWERVLRTMDRLGLTGAKEWTIECNPATVSADKAKLLRDFGVNRISMGVQSLDAALLDRLGRVHTREMAFKSYEILRRAGFANVNLDLMFAIPGQTLRVWQQTLREVVQLESEHLSAYEVIYEEDTPLYESLKAGKIREDEDLACGMFDELLEAAEGAGFRRYEVANFARDRSCSGQPHQDQPESPQKQNRGDPSHACQHNLNYWRGGSFVGLGPSATTYVGGVRTKNWPNTQRYCEELKAGHRPIESREQLSPLSRAGETAAFGLRMVDGWPFEEFEKVTGYDLRREWAGEMKELVARGWGRITAENFQLTQQGLRFADAAAELFLR